MQPLEPETGVGEVPLFNTLPAERCRGTYLIRNRGTLLIRNCLKRCGGAARTGGSAKSLILNLKPKILNSKR